MIGFLGSRKKKEAERIRYLDEGLNDLASRPLVVRYTELQPFEETDKTYTDELARIGMSQEFRFFLYSLRELTVARLEELPASESDIRAQITGELKGYAKIRTYLESLLVAKAQK